MASNLLLIPTAIERDKIVLHLDETAINDRWTTQLCGFGQIAAAARTSQLIAKYCPEKIVLVGIAGVFSGRGDVGVAHQFSEVTCDGIGVGAGETFRSASEIGWAHFADIGDTIELGGRSDMSPVSAGRLLSVCAASESASEADARADRFPDAVAEDMEAFGVAMACQMHKVPLQVVRGISNQVGDRDQRRWQIDKALQAAAVLVNRLFHRR
ncbi:Futalosine nucleosidase [Rhodopirellula maiorica SM1]|uniref:Futalosine hydrolase n=1 Tax=Rhodopirellula maiorica SM1 TaxID=1265738 RepID=M5REW7_9BACT|nr:futalosine hydrolase [Rhodopirellula maiorica]EMI18013.1 Futalosine nucleosidase [Rhodopirellula maiorica SM1]